MLVFPTTVIPNVHAQDQTCADKVTQQMRVNSQNIDTTKARSLSSTNNELQGKLNGYKYKLDSISTGWSFDSNCNVTLTGVQLSYILSDSTGYVKNVIVLEDPSLSTVTKIQEEVGKKFFSTTHSSTWSGYEVYGACSPTCPDAYDAYGSWTEPTASKPSSGGQCSTPHCDMAIWVGLEDQFGAANNHLAQTGTDAVVNCGIVNCPVSYNAWYEFLPSDSVNMTMVSVHKNDAITSEVINAYILGGTSTLYDVSVVDSTSSTSQYVYNVSYGVMSDPQNADFIVERGFEHDIGQQESLAAYSPTNLSIYGKTYYNGAYHGITDPYSASTYNNDIMDQNCSPNPNITLGSIGTGSTFSETYQNSCGT
ncbi:MAG: G1 family glutamic endopeptidase [Nitrosotalea sp.]